MSLCNSEEAFTFSSAGVNSGAHPDLLLCLLGCQVLDTHQRPVCLNPGERERVSLREKTSKTTGLPPCTQIPTKTFTQITKTPGGGLINMKHNKPRLKGDHQVNSSPFWQIQCHPGSADSHYDFIMRQQRRGGPAQHQLECSGRSTDPKSTHMKALSISAREECWWETTLFCSSRA